VVRAAEGDALLLVRPALREREGVVGHDPISRAAHGADAPGLGQRRLAEGALLMRLVPEAGLRRDAPMLGQSSRS
jgi:hypothetical protein